MTNNSTKRALITSVLSLFLCFTMLVGTTFAWFTDSIVSDGNIIQTGELKVGFQWAEGTVNPSEADWNDVSGAIFNYANWEPGYAVAKHLRVSNEGTLALNYQMRIVADGIVSKLADKIDVYYFSEERAVSREDVENAEERGEKLGTLTEVLGTDKNLSKCVKGDLNVGDSADIHTIVFKMNVNAGDEYKNMDLGCTFSLELLATQKAEENDSFGSDYDGEGNVPNSAIPAALVRPLEDRNVKYTTSFPNGTDVTNKELDVAYKFEPTISYEDVLNSKYRYWHADFVVFADRNVPADSMGLAGYYSAFCDGFNNGNWVLLTSPEDIAAGTEIRLVHSMPGGITVNWEEICNYGNDGKGFQCGAVDLTGENAGTTLTVELRLFETTKAWDAESGTANTETGNYITVGRFEYTFPAVPVADQEELDNAIAAGVTSIALGSGNYVMPDSAKGKDITIIGNGSTVISVVDDGGAEGDIDYSLEGSRVTFENLTLNIQGSNYPGYARIASAVYNNCTISGANYALYGDSVFNDCTFNLNNGYVWTWGASNVEFNKCTFEDTVGGKAKAILVHNTVETTVKVKDCTFVATNSASTWDGISVAAVSIDPENGSPDAKVYFEGTNVYSDAFYGLYQVKYADEVDDVSVYVNGEAVEVPVGEN